MFILSDAANKIVYKSDSAYIMQQTDGSVAFPSISEEGPTDVLVLNLSSAKEYDSQKKVLSFNGAFTYKEHNAYGQSLYDGAISTEEKAVIVTQGTLIDMSDSMLLFVNLTEDEAWELLLDIASNHKDSVKGRQDKETLEEFIRYADEKCGIVPEPEKPKGLFGFLHRK